MNTSAAATAWSARHVEQLLTAAALPLVLITAAPAGHTPDGLGLALAGVTWLPLTVRTRWPLPVATVVVLLDAVQIVVAGQGNPASGTLPAATLLALYTVGSRCPGRVTWIAAVCAALIQYVTALIAISNHPANDLLYLNWALLGAVIGRLVGERRERIRAAEARAADAEESKAAEARRQVIEERMRIARELHDVLAHHITVVNAQAGVAQYLLKSDPDAAERALAGIADNTRAALDELRATLGLLRSDADTDDTANNRAPAPGVDQLPQLIDRLATRGVEVRTRTIGSAYPLTAPADLALYRIAQEALTNAAKHASGAPVEVELAWAADRVTLTVTNAAPLIAGPAGTGTGTGTGHGLIGMRERAAAADGTFLAGPTGDGGFRVTAALPKPVRTVPAGARP